MILAPWVSAWVSCIFLTFLLQLMVRFGPLSQSQLAPKAQTLEDALSWEIKQIEKSMGEKGPLTATAGTVRKGPGTRIRILLVIRTNSKTPKSKNMFLFAQDVTDPHHSSLAFLITAARCQSPLRR